MHWLADSVRYYLLLWGYPAIALGLIGEDAGLPLPGETLLIFASYLAYRGEHFQLGWVIAVGIGSATLGDNLGYLFGRTAGRRMIKRWRYVLHITDADLAGGEALIHRHGSLAIFVARWIWGFRIMAGPLAGILRMDWNDFILFNFLGAVSWASTVATLGYLFGQFASLYTFFNWADITLTAAIALVTYYWWHRYRKNFRLAMKKARTKSKRTEEQKPVDVDHGSKSAK